VSLLSIFSKKKLTQQEQDLERFLKNVFGHIPKNRTFFIESLSHKSLLNLKESSEINNERLEFLGDAILDSIVAEYVYFKFPDESEGYLTKVKSKLVNRKTLSELGESIGIKKFLLYDDSRPINLESLQGNAFEALVGAIYLDKGYLATKDSLINHVFPKFLDINRVLEEEIDFKSKLMIWGQRNKLPVDFVLLDSVNDGGETIHTVEIKIKNTSYGRGKASSKKAAEQQAAKETLILIGEIE
jgi:ribonuclease-3